MARLPPQNFLIPGRGNALPGIGVWMYRNGQLHFQRWPKKQPVARTDAEAANRRILRQAAIAVPYMDAFQQTFARDLAARTQLAVRDFLFIAIFGRIGYLVRKDGTRIFSMAAMQDVSAILDAIAQTPGTMLVRGDVWWEGLAKGIAGQLLTADAEGNPMWATASPQAVLPAEPILMVPPLNPILGVTWAGGSYIGRPFLPQRAFTITGVRQMVITPGTNRQMVPAIYRANPSTRSLAGGTLLAQGPAVNYAVGLNILPLASAVPVVAGTWYYIGHATIGTGSNPTLARSDVLHDVSFFNQTTAVLPATAPAISDSQGAGFGLWAVV